MGTEGSVALSIVVPARGVSAYLPACLDSLLSDGSDLVEVVAVDDASPDDCGAIIDEYGRRDRRLRPLHRRVSDGPGPARNAGAAVATGEYVWFVDADDLVPVGALPAVMDRLARLRPDVLLLGNVLLNDDGRADPDPTGDDGECAGACVTVSERPSLLRRRQAAWNRVVRRALLERTGVRFPPGWYEDVSFSYLVLVAAESVSSLGEVAYAYRQGRTGAITSTPSERHFDVFDQYQRLFQTCDRWQASPGLRAQLFARMIEHYLVILGAEGRLPPDRRTEFFARIVSDYRRYLPAGGYPLPSGINGFKHRFVRWDSYQMFSALRNVYRIGKRTGLTNLTSWRPNMRDERVAHAGNAKRTWP